MNALTCDVLAECKLIAERDRLFFIALQDDCRRWQAIRDIYATIDPARYAPYPVDWSLLFTPIEQNAWEEIRCYGLPFFPQYPIGRFFADFADPVKKIVVECDGKAFHNHDSDQSRDRVMQAEGWTVYRISGADCNRILPYPWEELDDEGCVSVPAVREWALRTIDGLIWALWVSSYKPSGAEEYRQIAGEVLQHRTGAANA